VEKSKYDDAECFDRVLVQIDEERLERIESENAALKLDNNRLKARLFDVEHDMAAIKELLAVILEAKLRPSEN
jgi:hypothetical protein